MNKTDMQLKQEVEEELRWDPMVNAAQIGVSVDDGAVSLLGAVDTYGEKWAAEEATKRESGVRSVAHHLTVKLLTTHVRTDADIAAAVQSSLQWDVFVPKSVTAKVEQGTATLEGQVTWKYERDAAERAVRSLTGVVAVTDRMIIAPRSSAAQVKEKIHAALQRQAGSDAETIHIETSGSKVTLSGHASSWQAIEDASNAAWAAPGVTQVVDLVTMHAP